MAIFCVNFSCRISISFELRSKHFLTTPFLKNPNFISFCTNRDSSGPVRYIPKKPTSIKEPQTSLPSKNKLNEEEEFHKFKCKMPISRKNTRIAKSANIYEDDSDLGFEPCEMDVEKSVEDAKKIAIGALALRALTTVELQKKLREKGFVPKVIDNVISHLQCKGFVNDYLYAETFSQSRWSSSTWGPGRIKQALQRKGVSEVSVQKATKHVFESNGGDDSEEPSVQGMSKVSMDHLFLQASKQWLRGQNVPHEKRKARIIRWLQYRGFSWGVVGSVLKKLESQYPP
ncbi:regulatory protein RecX family protein [Thalictrum thalictroides]|uniref:Regulatory protein RecX n=1 Tax=Thalictrum thalictroides TaxID=46969 RepID=A0A7J6XB97_THATH|nr:regulatory protein RecX family protein [Thalictrum thalictroides]